MEKKIVIARIQVINGKENEFLSLTSPLIERTKAEPGNLVYTLYQDTQESSAFIVYEEYADKKAFNEHANSAHFQAFAQQVKTLLAKDMDIQIF